jgi:hypothetical protein
MLVSGLSPAAASEATLKLLHDSLACPAPAYHDDEANADVRERNSFLGDEHLFDLETLRRTVAGARDQTHIFRTKFPFARIESVTVDGQDVIIKCKCHATCIDEATFVDDPPAHHALSEIDLWLCDERAASNLAAALRILTPEASASCSVSHLRNP